jgi:DNA-binding NtrC family response regulator
VINPEAASTLIVVCDDAVRSALQRLLAAFGHHVLLAHNVGMARALLAEVRPRLLLIDFDTLASIELIAAAQAITGVRPIPLIVACDRLPRDAQRARGRCVWVQRPWMPETLRDAIRSALPR